MLACSSCHGSLRVERYGLRCSICKEKYPIQNGIPVLVDLTSLPKHLSGQIRYFKTEAKKYDGTHRLDTWQYKYIDRLSAFLGTYKRKVIVDNGSGSGYVTLEFAKRGANVIACDLNLSGLIRLRKVADAMGVGERVLAICCSSESLPIRGNVADVVVANAILEHLPKEKDAIADITRIAKRRAVAMITVPLAYHLINPLFLPINYAYDKHIGHLRRYTKEILSECFRGWKILQVSYSGHTWKVVKTLVNLIAPIFNEQEIEAEDERHEKEKMFASNISIIFRKK